MKQFDVFDVDDTGGVVAITVLSGSAYLDLPNVLAVPLYAAGFVPRVTRINPILDHDGRGLVAVVDEMGAVTKTTFGDCVGHLSDADQQRIKNALDRLIGGY